MGNGNIHSSRRLQTLDGFASLGIGSTTTEINYIIPHKGNQQLIWDENNLQALCKSCHSRKTAREDGGFGNIMEIGGKKMVVRARG